MANEIAIQNIFTEDNTKKVLATAPAAFVENRESVEACKAYGQKLIDAINQNGMTENLFKQAGLYLTKARNTVKKINDKRTPTTQLFDNIRSVFTSMESEINVKEKGTIPYQIQELRDRYVAQKLYEQQERQRIEREKQECLKAHDDLIVNLKREIHKKFNDYCTEQLRNINDTYQSTNLENFAESEKKIKETPVFLPDGFIENMYINIVYPTKYITPDEYSEAVKRVKNELKGDLKKNYSDSVYLLINELADMLPSLKKNLEAIAKADKEEAEKRQKMLDEQRRKENEERERQQKEQEEKQRQETVAQSQQAGLHGLFAVTATTAAPTKAPKAKITYKININNPQGIFEVINFWWAKQGCEMTVEELSKTFKKQISFCEKYAGEHEEFIKKDSVEYEQVIKAK